MTDCGATEIATAATTATKKTVAETIKCKK